MVKSFCIGCDYERVIVVFLAQNRRSFSVLTTDILSINKGEGPEISQDF
jgi:hypothetical protein